ncbi:DUF2968 domain-containing protein [Burkholderia pseudomultivorans]|uniref:DUF2968 domain-containing protein n=1 Tax=Burkholderia pseudomultivorans TaxID=1207504 RepID=UPI00075B8F26|nr:DUF2968 domain-containing protein [Burkholderia pseudomultivorans]
MKSIFDMLSRRKGILLAIAVGAASLAGCSTQPASWEADDWGYRPQSDARTSIDTAATGSTAHQPATGMSVLSAEEAKGDDKANVAELRRLLYNPRIEELRTAYNGRYGASLLFYGKTRIYYVAFFHDKKFSRVVKTGDASRASTIYQNFVQESLRLSGYGADSSASSTQAGG